MMTNSCRYILTAVVFTFTQIPLLGASQYKVNISNDGPAILDSVITFYAELSGLNVENNDFLYIFKSSNRGRRYEVNGKNKVNLSLTFSETEQREGIYSMEVKVYKEYPFLKKEVASTSGNFQLSRDIVGQIVLTQGNKTRADDLPYLSTNETANFTFQLHDPSGFFKNAVNSLSWKIDHGSSHYSTYLEHNFTDTKQHTVYLVVVSVVENRKNSTDASYQSLIKIGSFTREVHPKNPILSVDVEGNMWLRHGDVLNLEVSCNGSSPYSYCWKMFNPNSSESHSANNMTCEDPITTNLCRFPIVHYFPDNGPHFIGIAISNDVDRYVRNLEIHIYDVPPQGLLSTIILPISCSILAFVIMVTGIAYHIHTRNSLPVEVADFDFTRSDMLVGKTFFERVKGAFREAFPMCNRTRMEQEGTITDDVLNDSHPTVQYG